jgi:hypothetical protein
MSSQESFEEAGSLSVKFEFEPILRGNFAIRFHATTRAVLSMGRAP